jgi:hypothetical protein
MNQMEHVHTNHHIHKIMAAKVLSSASIFYQSPGIITIKDAEMQANPCIILHPTWQDGTLTLSLAVDTRRRLPLPSNFGKTANQAVVTMFNLQTLIVSHMCASFKGEIELETGIRVNLHIPLLSFAATSSSENQKGYRTTQQ